MEFSSNYKGQSWGFTLCSTARVMLGQVLSIVTCGTRTHRVFPLHVFHVFIGPPPTYPTVPTSAPGECPSSEWIESGSDCFLVRPTQYLSWQGALE